MSTTTTASSTIEVKPPHLVIGDITAGAKGTRCEYEVVAHARASMARLSVVRRLSSLVRVACDPIRPLPTSTSQHRFLPPANSVVKGIAR